MRRLPALLLVAVFLPTSLRADEKELIKALQEIPPISLTSKPDYGAELRRRREEFNRADIESWRKTTSLAAWQKRREEVVVLHKFVVPALTPQKEVKHLVTGTIPGEGFVIENIVYETIPGLVVTANLYRPEPAVKNPPAILIISSHHNPKTQGELQDMGMTWARLGCLVLVPDQLGHGERRQHPFKDASSFEEKFKVGRQDYYFRYNVGVQLALIGESLAGWMARDMMRGVDLVLQRGADPKRIILLGSVAGGGDPAAVTAAVDERIACVVPFNFGGPQPETKFPLPKDAEMKFNYFGGGSWESTRNLAYSMSGGFPHWAIVAAAAPRRVIHAHEFAWDKDNDPVWKRYETIWEWHKARDGIGFAHGRGSVTGMPPEATHCNNIGPIHRAMIYPYLKRWFDIPVPEKEYQNRVSSEKLLCLTDKAREVFKIKTISELTREVVAGRKVAKLEDAPERLVALKHLLEAKPWIAGETRLESPKAAGISVDRRLIESDSRLPVVAQTILFKEGVKGKRPLVVAFSQQGSTAFLKERAETIAALLEKGAAVALLDVRGVGALATGDGRGRTSGSTSHSATEWMMGHSLLEERLRDLRTALAVLRMHPDVDGEHIVLWGDSFAPRNERVRTDVPYEVDNQPKLSEPMGQSLALFAALKEPNVRGVYARGGLISYESVLADPFIWTPHDVMVPGLLSAGDLPQVAASLARRFVRLEAPVTGTNRPAATTKALEIYDVTRAAYSAAKAEGRFAINAEESNPREVAEWMLRCVSKGP